MTQIRDSGFGYIFASITLNHELKVGRVSAKTAFPSTGVTDCVAFWNKTGRFVARNFSGCGLSEQKRDVLLPGIFRAVSFQDKKWDVYFVARFFFANL